MTPTIDVANATRSDLILPCGTRIPARGSAPVSVTSLQEHRNHPVVKHWFASGELTAAEPIPEPEPAPECEIVEKPKGKFSVVFDGQTLTSELLASREEAEAFIATRAAQG